MTLLMRACVRRQPYILKVTHGVDNKVTRIDERVKDVDDKVKLVLDDGKETKEIIQRTTKEATDIMQLITSNVDEVKRNQWRQDLRRRLSPSDPSTNHILLGRAQHEGTATWFFRGSLLEGWKSSGSLLWIHGKPGSGKSVLCSAVIQDIMALRDARLATMAYYYFDFRDTDKQDRRNLLLSLLSQLSARSDLCCDLLYRAYITHDNGTQKPADNLLIQILKDTLTLSTHGPIYLIIDALDECPNTFGVPSPRDIVLGFVKEHVELFLPNLHICVTSRPEIDIQTVLSPLTPFQVSIHDETGQKEDIVEYVKSVVRSDARMGKWREENQELVIETLSERADGMFRCVFCQLEVLRHCSPPSLRQTLQMLPESLDETYERVLKNINKAQWAYAHRLLQCLTVASRPLRLSELAEVLAFDFEAPVGIPKLNADWRREDQEQAVLSTCSSLITVVGDGESRVVQFSHFSVKEFLTSDRLARAIGDISFHHIALAPAHTILAQACLCVLLRLDDGAPEIAVQCFPLAEYAARHWFDHALFSDASLHMKDGTEDLFDADKPHFSRWIRIHDIEEEYFQREGERDKTRMHLVRREATPLYYAALCGLPGLVKKLINKRPEHVNARGGRFGTALHAASRRNHVEIAQSLLEHGTTVDARGYKGYTPLHVASRWRSNEIGRWLLEHGADVNAKLDYSFMPLHLAVYQGQFELVRTLLGHNADVDALDSSGSTPLHMLSTGRVDIVRLLLDHGADPNSRDNDAQWRPLHWAAYFGKLEIAHLLIERGANVHVKDKHGRIAYQIALERGEAEIAQLLLSKCSENKT